MALEKMVEADERVKPEYYFDLSKFRYRDVFDNVEYVWDALKGLDNYIRKKLEKLGKGDRSGVKEGAFVDDDVYLGKGTSVDHGAVIHGPTIIGDKCQIRAGAFFRGNVLVGNEAMLRGEIKSSILFDEANAPHICYIGNSIIGYKTNLAGGVETSPHNFNRTPLVVEIEEKKYETGMVKFGSVIGDKTVISCNCTLNPASLIGPNSVIYANISWRGFLPKESIVKPKEQPTIVVKRDMSRTSFERRKPSEDKNLYD